MTTITAEQLITLKKEIAELETEKLKLQGQSIQLAEQKKAIVDEITKLGVTLDGLPIQIEALTKELLLKKSEIDAIYSKVMHK